MHKGNNHRRTGSGNGFFRETHGHGNSGISRNSREVWAGLVSKGGVFSQIDRLVHDICMRMPSSAAGDYQARMHELQRSDEVRQLHMLARHLPPELGFPREGTEMDIIVWTHQRGAHMVGHALLA